MATTTLVFEPFLELSLSQTNSQGAYLYRPGGQLAASCGRKPGEDSLSGFGAMAELPLVHCGEPVGRLYVCRIGTTPFGESEAAFLRDLGVALASIMALENEVEELSRKLADRKLLDRAKGILQASRQWTEKEAYLFLRNTSRRQRTPMREIARACGGRSHAERPMTRKDFLLALPGAAVAHALQPKLLIVVAHPDDEYAFAATTYRLTRELGWAADLVVITNGEAGYRYSALAEAVYGVVLTSERDARSRLPAIRRRETLAAGKVLGHPPPLLPGAARFRLRHRRALCPHR